MKFALAAGVDKGKIRENNEDNLYFDGVYLKEEERDAAQRFTKKIDDENFVVGVFDGMGGSEYGERASLIAAKTVLSMHDGFNMDVNIATSRLVKHANNLICDEMIRCGAEKMGTTLALLCVKGDIARVYNVGDSRVYIIRNGKIKQISIDDTFVRYLIESGMITKEEAKTHKDRHRITQHLGIFPEDIIIEEHRSGRILLEKGDKLLLCSDGITDMLEDDEIENIVNNSQTVEEGCEKLIQNALDKGGYDNITVVLAEALTDGKVRKKKNRVVVGILIALIIIFGIIAGMFFMKSNTQEIKSVIKCENLYWPNEIERINVGDSGVLLVGFEPINFEGKAILSSSNPEVIEVDAKTGKYTALSEGETTITASVDGKSIEMNVTVENDLNKEVK